MNKLLQACREYLCTWKIKLQSASDFEKVQASFDSSGGERFALLARLDQNGDLLERYFIFKREFWIGRDPDLNELVLSSKQLSPRHCRISHYAGNFYIEDFNSENGTYLNGRKLPRHRAIKLPEQARIKLADLNFFFQIEG
ncbi:MAG: FHA domain-containing protein [Eubacteriales bacterium]|nr:FHA domain-containing protein [Eubacteriales bacterium]